MGRNQSCSFHVASIFCLWHCRQGGFTRYSSVVICDGRIIGVDLFCPRSRRIRQLRDRCAIACEENLFSPFNYTTLQVNQRLNRSSCSPSASIYHAINLPDTIYMANVYDRSIYIDDCISRNGFWSLDSCTDDPVSGFFTHTSIDIANRDVCQPNCLWCFTCARNLQKGFQSESIDRNH